MKDDSFVILRPFMINTLGLKGTDLIVFAIIFGFSVQEQPFTGSAKYLMEWTKGSRSKVFSSLKSLTEKGLIEKTEKWVGSQKYCEYTVPDSIRVQNPNNGVQNLDNLVQNLDNGVQELDPIIKSNNKENSIEVINTILSYLNEKAGKNYRLTDSVSKLINGRLKEGFTLEDFKKVIDIKCSHWANDKDMKQYLRPSTLFSPTHFQEYLNQDKKGDVPVLGTIHY